MHTVFKLLIMAKYVQAIEVRIIQWLITGYHTHCKWIIGIYLHSFTNNERKIFNTARGRLTQWVR